MKEKADVFTLEEFFRKRTFGYGKNQRIYIFRMIQNEIKILHESGYTLIDLIPKNILITSEYKIQSLDINTEKITDEKELKEKIQNDLYIFYKLFIKYVLKLKDNTTKEEIKRRINKWLPKSFKAKEKLLAFVDMDANNERKKLDYLLRI